MKMRRKKERSKQGQTNKQGKATQHTQGSHFYELPWVGLEPTTLYTLDRALYQLSYQGSSAGWAQISHLIVHLMNRLTITCTSESLLLHKHAHSGQMNMKRNSSQEPISIIYNIPTLSRHRHVYTATAVILDASR